MSDPLSEIVRLLHPQAVFANPISGKGNWAVRYSEFGKPSFCIMLEGSCRLAMDGHEPTTLSAGDFVLLPTTPGFTISSFAPAPPVYMDPNQVREGRGELRYGEQTGQPDMRSWVARSCSTAPIRVCWCRCCRKWCTCKVRRGCRS